MRKLSTERLNESREIEASSLEIESALSAPYPFVFLVAGAGHLPQALKRMDQANVNYIVLKTDSFDTLDYLPDANGEINREPRVSFLDIMLMSGACTNLDDARLRSLQGVYEHLEAIAEENTRKALEEFDEAMKECGLD